MSEPILETSLAIHRVRPDGALNWLEDIEVAAWLNRDMTVGHSAHISVRCLALPDGHLGHTVQCEEPTTLDPSELDAVETKVRLESLKLAHMLLAHSKGVLS
jgi:hypothetical protein